MKSNGISPPFPLENLKKFQKNLVPPPNGDFSFMKNLNPPYTIEIGCGTGIHAINWVNNPSKPSTEPFLAIEKTREKFRKFKEAYDDRLLNYGEKNLFALYPIHANAISFLSHYIPYSSVKTYFILYPNPYPKKKQANLRFHNMPFMEFLVETLQHQGELIWASNILEQKEEALERFCNTWGLQLIAEESLTDPNQARTLFEKKYLERGQICYQLKFKKIST